MSATCDSPSEASSPIPDALASIVVAMNGEDGDGVTQGDVTAEKCDTVTHVKDRTPVRWAALEVLVR